MKITFLFSFFISISMGFLYFEDWVFLFSKIPPFSVCIKTIFEKGNEMNENKKSDEHLLNFLSLFLVVSLFCCFFFLPLIAQNLCNTMFFVFKKKPLHSVSWWPYSQMRYHIFATLFGLCFLLSFLPCFCSLCHVCRLREEPTKKKISSLV